MKVAVRAVEVLLFLVGFISVLVMAKSSVYFSSLLLGFRDSIRCFLSSPLYICIMLHSMVGLIAVLSTFYPHETNEQDHEYEFEINLDHDLGASSSVSPTLHQIDCLDNMPSGSEQCCNEVVDEGGDLNEGMDAMWEVISAGAGKKKDISQNLNKSETWPPPRTTMDNAATVYLRETVGGGEGPIKRDQSIRLEELNKRFEDFIDKFNRDMQLQRQESDQRFLDMIKRGL